MTNRELLNQWLADNKLAPSDLAAKCGLRSRVVSHLASDTQFADFDPRKMSPAYRAKLYDATKLELFKTTPQMIAGPDINLETLEPWQHGLLNWMADNQYNRAQVEKKLKIGKGTMSAYCREPTRPETISQVNKKKLYSLTKLEALAPINGDKTQSAYSAAADADPASVPLPVPAAEKKAPDGLDALLTTVQELTTAIQERMPIATRTETDNELLKRTRVVFYDVLETFEQYKARPDARDKLRESVTAREASYLCALLNSLYAKDEFARIQLDQPRPQGVQR